MSNSFNDHDLLYGILAVQMGFTSREQLIQSISDWKAKKPDNLGILLLELGALSEHTKSLLDALVEEHLAQHDNDAVKSLATLSTIGSLGDELKTLGAPDVNATLAHLPTMSTRVSKNSTKASHASSYPAEANRFRILRMHAKGGIGQVSVAVDDELSREVALKELQARFADDQNTRARFVLEAEITGGLEHPGVVPVYGLGHYADGRPFYAMRFVRGDSLHDALQQFHQRLVDDPSGKGYDLDLRKLLRRFIDVCDAIEYAHSRGVLHRDLKPGNIMLGRYGETLVVDWGLAKVGTASGSADQSSPEFTLQPASADDSAPTQLGSTVGTPHYMSPEQAAGNIDQLGVTSDVYSLGATLYHVLTGRPPFRGTDVGEILAAAQIGVIRRARSINRRVAKPLEAICVKAMALEPQDRYSTARALAEDIERWLADEPVEALPESVLRRIQRWTRRHRGFTLATAVGLSLVSAISGIAYVAVSSERDEARKQRDRAIVSEEEAQKSFLDSEKARTIAVEHEQRAERVAYNSTLSEASRLLGSDPMMARSLLENEVRCPSQQRDFLWRCLMRQVVREERAVTFDKLNAHAICYSPGGDIFATGGAGGGEVLLWNVGTGKQIAVLETDLDYVQEILFSPEGKNLAALSWESSEDEESHEENIAHLQIWDVTTQQRLIDYKKMLPFNSTLASSDAGFFFHAFVSEFQYSNTHPEYVQKYESVADENGKIIDRWYQWRRYNVQTDEETAKVIKLEQGAKLIEGFTAHAHWLTCTVRTPNGDVFWIHDIEKETSKTAEITSLPPGSSLSMIAAHESSIFFLGMTFLEDTISEIDSLAYLDLIEFVMDVSFLQFDFENPRIQQSVPLGRMPSGLYIEERGQLFALDRQRKALAMLLDRQPVIQLVDLEHPEMIHRIPAHLGDVVSLAISPDGQQLASFGLDRTLRLWNVPQLFTKREYAEPSVERPRRLLLTPDGNDVILLALGPDFSENDVDDVGQPIPDETLTQPAIFFQSETLHLSDAVSAGTTDFQDPPKYKPAPPDVGPMGVFGAFSEGLGNVFAGMFETHPVRSEGTESKLSADGAHLILAGPDRLLRFELETGQAEELWGPYYPDLHEPMELNRIVVSDDLELFATLANKGRTISVYDLASRKLLWQQSQMKQEVSELKFVPNSHSLLVVEKAIENDDSLERSLCEIHDVSDQSVRSLKFPSLEGIDTWSFSQDGKLLIAYKRFDRQVLVLDLDTGEIVSQVYLVTEKPAGIFPQSELLMLFGENGELKLWDIRLDQYRATLQLFEGEVVSNVVLSHDGNTLVALGKQGSLRFLGADRLRDDLANIHALMQVASRFPDGNIAVQDQPAGIANVANEIPQIEIVDDIPNLPLSPNRPFDPTEAAPIPPAPARDDNAPTPPSPTIDPSA